MARRGLPALSSHPSPRFPAPCLLAWSAAPRPARSCAACPARQYAARQSGHIRALACHTDDNPAASPAGGVLACSPPLCAGAARRTQNGPAGRRGRFGVVIDSGIDFEATLTGDLLTLRLRTAW